MRKVELRMNELEKYKTIKKLVEENGNKKRAAIKLQCTVRTVYRLIQKYNEFGKEAFVHGNRGRKPSTTIPEETKKFIISLYKDDYPDANYQQFCEILFEDHDISISSTTLNYWLRQENILSPKAKRNTKKALKKKIKQQLHESKSTKESNELKQSLETIDVSEAHPRKERCKYIGELLQMDASEYFWIPGIKWHLHIAVDDATGAIHGAYFDYQETLSGYYHVLYQILKDYGIPFSFLTDRRTVFEYKRKNTLMDEDDTFTQFSYACKQLGIEIKTTSVAQAKGRVERMNQTLQSRLPIELRRAHITTIEQANEFLKSYLKKFNAQFALQVNSNKSVYDTQPSDEQINRTLAVISERVIDKGHCAKYKKNFYIPVDASGNKQFFFPKTKCLMIEAFDGNLYMTVEDDVFLARKIEEHQHVSKNFDPPQKEKKERKKYIPPMTHPWRRQSFTIFRDKQTHRMALN